MARIAHLSDVHLVERGHRARRLGARARIELLSLFRSIDAEDRATRLERSLRAALLTRPDHVCLTGDLTEDGTDAQFEVLAEVLDRVAIDPSRVTIVPGNHDGYDDPSAFSRAMKGPLRAYAPTSESGAHVELGEAVLVPASTLVPQHYLRSVGAVDDAAHASVKALARSEARGTRAIVVAQHHPPFRQWPIGIHHVDGNLTSERDDELARTCERLHVLHGHTHRATDRAIGGGTGRAFGVKAVVEHEVAFRVYEACDGKLVPVSVASPARPAMTFATA